MRRLLLGLALAALALPSLAGGMAPSHADQDAPPASREHALETTSAAPASCAAPTVDARIGGHARYVALRWDAVCDAPRYTLLRGPSAAELVPLVVLGHTSHVDVAIATGTTYVYAVQPEGLAIGPATAVNVPRG